MSWNALNVCVCSATRSYLTLCDPMDHKLPGSSVHGIFASKNTGAGCHFLLQGIFPTQESNPHLLHWQADSLPLSHLGSPGVLSANIQTNKNMAPVSAEENCSNVMDAKTQVCLGLHWESRAMNGKFYLQHPFLYEPTNLRQTNIPPTI